MTFPRGKAFLAVFQRFLAVPYLPFHPTMCSSYMHFPFLFDLFFISRQYVNIPWGEQADLAVCSTPAGCNGSSGTPAAIQLNNQIVKELWVRLIRLSKISVHSVKDFGFRIIYGGKKISGDCGRDYLIQLQQQKLIYYSDVMTNTIIA